MSLNQIQDNIYETEQELDYDCYQISDSDESYNPSNDLNLVYDVEEYDNQENNLLTKLIDYFLSLFKK
jgi:hypothetical protein